MYIEACESGSMFEGTLDDSLKIYAVVRMPASQPAALLPRHPGAITDPSCYVSHPLIQTSSSEIDTLLWSLQTAANAAESSWGAYCPGQTPGPPPEYGTCLGDLFSISFLENECAHIRSTLPSAAHRIILHAITTALLLNAQHSGTCPVSVLQCWTLSWLLPCHLSTGALYAVMLLT